MDAVVIVASGRRQGGAGRGVLVRLVAIGLALGGGLLVAAAPGGAAAAGSVELAVKATYLYKIQPFVEWPSSAFATPSSPFNLCVVGGDPFGGLLDRAVAGQHFGTRPIAVVRLSIADRASPCQMMYLAGGGPQSVADALRAVSGTPVLTVTDSAVDPADKGIVNFVIRGDHVRLEIDDAAAARNHLTISSKLLGIAVSVTPREASPR